MSAWKRIRSAEFLGTEVLLPQCLRIREAYVRFAAGLLPRLAETLNTSIEELIGETSAAKPGKRGPAPKIQQQLERVSSLPKPDQRAVMRVLDSMLAQAGR